MAGTPEILAVNHVIAVVGLSDKPSRPSHEVSDYMKSHGYHIIPVNPNLMTPVLGEQPYPDLESVSEKIDIVNVFRNADLVIPIVESAIGIGAKVIWMQKGIVNYEAAVLGEEAGLIVIMDK